MGTRIDLTCPRRVDAARRSVLRSPLGLGTDMTRTPVPVAVTRTEPDSTPATGDPATVLLVDDESMIRTIGRAVLEKEGFRVLTADDGVEAVEVFGREHSRIALVVLDVTMPRMSGRDAFRHLVEIDPAVRVLFSTGFATSDIAELGGTGLLPKPYRPHELLAAVQAALTPETTPAA